MSVNNAILRTDAEVLIPVEEAKEIVQGAIHQSMVLSQFTQLPNMASKEYRMPVLNLLPQAYFVDGDTGMKQTTKVDWKDKFIVAEEIAVIVPIPDAVLDDASYDLYAEITPLVQQAFGKVIDEAILFGVDKPTSWRESIVDSAIASGNTVVDSGNLFDDLMAEDGVISKVEVDGFLPTGYISTPGMRGKLRGLRSDGATGSPLFTANLREDQSPYSLDGSPIHFALNGAFDESKALLIAGDFKEAVYSIRQDLTVKVLDQAVISDNDGKIIFNLAQQDMTALRFVMRLGWQVKNATNAVAKLNEDGTKRQFPFSILAPKE